MFTALAMIIRQVKEPVRKHNILAAVDLTHRSQSGLRVEHDYDYSFRIVAAARLRLD